MASNLSPLLADLREAELLDSLKERLTAGESAVCLLEELRQGMDLVGARFDAREYYLAELILAGMAFKSAMAVLEPCLSEGDSRGNMGRVVLGTAKGDVHDIGKNIVAVMLKGAGFEVIDLGVDVAPSSFVKAVAESGARVVGISALLTVAFNSMKQTVEALDAAGLRGRVTVALGGAPVNEEVRRYVGADFVGRDAREAVDICRRAVESC